MKITIIHHTSSVGGGTICIVDICKMLFNENEITVVLPQKNSETLSNMIRPYANIRYFDCVMPQISYYSGSNNVFTRGFLKSFFVSESDAQNITKIIADTNPDLILANSVIQCAMGKYLKNIDAKKIIYIRETFRENCISRMMISMINKYFDGVLCIAPYEKKYADFKIPCEVVADCYSYDGEITSNPYKKNDKFKILFMGGNASIKGLQVLLNSIEYTVSKNIEYNILGTISKADNSIISKIYNHKYYVEYKTVESLLQKYSDRVNCYGFQKNTADFISNCDALVFPSTTPHQSRPAIEAGTFKKPVIISDFKQTRDYMVNGENCLTFTPNDPIDLAKKIDELSCSAEKCEKLGENNYKFSNQMHSFNTEKLKLIDFINKVTEKGK